MRTDDTWLMMSDGKGIEIMTNFHGFETEPSNVFVEELVKSFAKKHIFGSTPIPLKFQDIVRGNHVDGFVSVHPASANAAKHHGITVFPYCYKLSIFKTVVSSSSVQTESIPPKPNTGKAATKLKEVQKHAKLRFSGHVPHSHEQEEEEPGPSHAAVPSSMVDEVTYFQGNSDDNDDIIVAYNHPPVSNPLRNAKPILSNRHANFRNKLSYMLKKTPSGSILILDALAREQCWNLNRIMADYECMVALPQIVDEFAQDDITSFDLPISQDSLRSSAGANAGESQTTSRHSKRRLVEINNKTSEITGNPSEMQSAYDTIKKQNSYVHKPSNQSYTQYCANQPNQASSPSPGDLTIPHKNSANTRLDSADTRQDSADARQDFAYTRQDSANTRQESADARQDSADTCQDSADTRQDSAYTRQHSADTRQDSADTRQMVDRSAQQSTVQSSATEALGSLPCGQEDANSGSSSSVYLDTLSNPGILNSEQKDEPQTESYGSLTQRMINALMSSFPEVPSTLRNASMKGLSRQSYDSQNE